MVKREDFFVQFNDSFRDIRNTSFVSYPRVRTQVSLDNRFIGLDSSFFFTEYMSK